VIKYYGNEKDSVGENYKVGKNLYELTPLDKPVIE
jgi:hypothetical protein